MKICAFMLFIFVVSISGCTSDTPSINPYLYECFNFDDPVPAQTVAVGGQLASSVGSLTVSPGPFSNPNGLDIDSASYSGGSGQDARFNNIVAGFSFHTTPQKIVFQFADLGGTILIDINGTVMTPTDFVSLNGQTVAGVDVEVNAITNGANWYGVMALSGAISKFALGGQELWVDNVCSLQLAETVAIMDLRKNDPVDPDLLVPDILVSTIDSDLRASGIAVHKHTSGEMNNSLLTSADILILFPKRGRLSAAEKDDIREYIELGGKALIFTDYASSNTATLSVLQDLLAMVDATHGDQTIGSALAPLTLSSSNMDLHRVTQGVSSFNMYAATTVTGSTYDRIVHTANTVTPYNTPLIMGRSLGNGRVIISGDVSFIYDPAIQSSQNRIVFANMISWLLE